MKLPGMTGCAEKKCDKEALHTHRDNWYCFEHWLEAIKKPDREHRETT